MRTWLNSSGFEILEQWGDWRKSVYTEHSDLAVFWARQRNWILPIKSL